MIRTAVALAFVGLCYLVLLVEIAEGGALTQRFFNADALFLPALHTDLFPFDGRWRDWQLPAAPYYFPDMVVYFALLSLLGRFEWAAAVYGLVQFLALLLALRAVFAHLLGTGARHESVLFAGGAVLLALAAGHAEFFLFALLPDFHTSALLFGLIGFCLLRRYEARRRGRDLAILLVLTALLSASDRLFLLVFVVPAVLYLWRWGAFSRRRGLLVALGLATGLGLALYYADAGWLRDPPLPSAAREGDVTWARFRETCIEHPLLAVTVALSAVVHLLLWWQRARLSPSAVRFFLCSHLAVILGTVLITRKGDVLEHQRFFNVIWLFGVLGAWPLARTLLPSLPAVPARWQTAAGISALLLPGLLLARATADAGMADPLAWRFYPRITRCIDDTAPPGPVVAGLANYWMARLVSLTSRRAIVMVPIDRELERTTLAQNVAVHARVEAFGGYRFVLPWRGITTEALEQRLRPPNLIVSCPEVPDPKTGRDRGRSVEIWYYRRPVDPWGPETDPEKVREKWAYRFEKGGIELHVWEPRR